MRRFLLLVLLTAPFVLMLALVVEVRAADSESSESEEETLKTIHPVTGLSRLVVIDCFRS